MARAAGSNDRRKLYPVLMRGRWGLDDLYRLPRAYLNAYAFVYCFDTDLQPRDVERIDTALQEYPWKGGYSYVNVYSVLRNQIPASERPLIKAIEYHSPGSIDLLLNVDVALQVAKSVGILLGAAAAAAKTYAAIYKTLADIKKDRAVRDLKIAKLAQAQLRVLMGMYDDLAKAPRVQECISASRTYKGSRG
jgi:hypothetical protein